MTTWARLQSDVIALTDRTDISTKVSLFAELFEARIRRNLRMSQMEEAFSGTIDANNEIAKPADWLAFRAVWPDGYESRQLTAQSLDTVVAQFVTSSIPTMYAVKSGAFLFDGSGDVSGVYYQDIPGIEANGSNWLSVASYDAYLFGCLAEAWDYIGDDAQFTKYMQRSSAVLDQLMAADKRDKFSGPLQARKR